MIRVDRTNDWAWATSGNQVDNIYNLEISYLAMHTNIGITSITAMLRNFVLKTLIILMIMTAQSAYHTN